MKRSVKSLKNGNNDESESHNQDIDDDDDIIIDDEEDIFYLPKRKRSRHRTNPTTVKQESQKNIQLQFPNPTKKPIHEKTIQSEERTPKVKIIECSNSSNYYNNNSGDGGDDEKETKSTSKRDIPHEYVSHVRLLAGKKDNALVTTFLAINIFLQPRNVYSTTLYWISQYVNYKKSNQIHWFTDHIYKLMKYPVDFNMTATRGVSDFHSKEVKYNLLIHTIGSNLHKIPCEYFIIQSNESMLRSIAYLLDPSNECFITNRHHGLKGELEIDSFVYNSVMNFIYEPSFFIITSYLHYTYQLFFATGGRNILDYTDILDMIIIPLRLEGCSKLGCLSESSTNYESKKNVFIQDMKELLDIYESNALHADGIINGLKALWSKKATYCFNIVPERYLAIHKQLY